MQLDKKTYDSQTDPMQSHINVGFGSDITIAELAQAVKSTVGYEGRINFDPLRPDGAPRKWMSSRKLNNLGWSAKYSLTEGLLLAYLSFIKDKSI
jgi:GDP-L-fucose synthase